MRHVNQSYIRPSICKGIFAIDNLNEQRMLQYKQSTELSGHQAYYSLYKKKRKHYIMFNNLSTFKDEHFKLTDYLDLYVLYQ